MRLKFTIIIVLLALTAFAFFRWQVEVEVSSGVDSNLLTFGVDSMATNGFDIMLDIPYLPTPGAYGYFPIDDSAYPGYTMLGTDYRTPSQDTVIWDVILSGGYGFSLTWNSTEVPDSGEFSIGAFNLDSLPRYFVDEWFDMRTVDSIGIDLLGGRIIAVGAPISAIEEKIQLPEKARIHVVPNPFNSSCRIETPPDCGEIGIFDISGRMIDVLYTDLSEISWDGRSKDGGDCPSGIYYFKPTNGGIPATKAVMLK